MPPRPGSDAPYVVAGRPRRSSGGEVPMLPARSRAWMATRYVPGETGRPLGVVPSHVHCVASSGSGIGAPTARSGPGDVLNSRTFFLALLPRPGALKCTIAGPPPGAGRSSGRGTVSWTGPIDATRTAGGGRGARPRVGDRPDRRDAARGRGRVEPHRLRDHDVAPLVGQRDPVAVVAVGNALAVVVAPVPARADLAVGQERVVVDELADLVAAGVDDRERHAAALAGLEPHDRAVEATVAVGREERAAAELAHDRRGRLQALGDEERAERRDDERGEHDADDATHSVTSVAFSIWRPRAVWSPVIAASARRMTPRWQTTSAGSLSAHARRSRRPA